MLIRSDYFFSHLLYYSADDDISRFASCWEHCSTDVAIDFVFCLIVVVDFADDFVGDDGVVVVGLQSYTVVYWNSQFSD